MLFSCYMQSQINRTVVAWKVERLQQQGQPVQEKEESQFRQQYPNYLDAFADITEADMSPRETMDEEDGFQTLKVPASGVQQGTSTPHLDQSWFAQSLAKGDFLDEVVHLHARFAHPGIPV